MNNNNEHNRRRKTIKNTTNLNLIISKDNWNKKIIDFTQKIINVEKKIPLFVEKKDFL